LLPIISYRTRQIASRDYALLQTVPGIGRSLALTILYEIESIERFPTVKDFCSYCRLVKGSVASAGKIKDTRGAKLGNPYLRWAFGEAAVIGKRDNPLLRPYAQRLEAAHGKHKANAILANKLARAVYSMLRTGTGFDGERLVAGSVGPVAMSTVCRENCSQKAERKSSAMAATAIR
jgi:transposase